MTGVIAKIAVIVAVTIGGLFWHTDGDAATEKTASKLVEEFKCVHHYEGSWTSVGYVHGVRTYFGGFQMDRTFERTYGREFLRAFGNATHWPPALQLAVAIRAWTHRGFQPWPVSARMCGLLP